MTKPTPDLDTQIKETRTLMIMELNKQIKETRTLIVDLRYERERVRIGFLDSETPRLMNLLNDTVRFFEKLTKEAITRRRELKRLQKENHNLETEIKPIPLVEPPSKREEKKRKTLGKTFTPSRKHHLL